ncbi:MAG: response regulator transcription factor [Flavobacteriales bacterium]|jgi:DNA-binding NarL/FixJ family response regulator|nr:response regulator transcription factor [Flavobacteriales bacterium]
MISLTIVDDDALIVSLLEKYFTLQEDIEVLSTACSGEEFLTNIKAASSFPDILILDLKMKNMSGIDVMKSLKKNYPEIKVIVMSSHYKQSFMGFMLKTGVSAFIPKGISPEELTNVVREVAKNGYSFFSDQLNIVREQISPKSPAPVLNKGDVLSSREVEVLKLICLQKTAKEISEELFLSTRTVEGHKNNLFLKTETKNIAGLVVYAIQNKIIDINEIPLV